MNTKVQPPARGDDHNRFGAGLCSGPGKFRDSTCGESIFFLAGYADDESIADRDGFFRGHPREVDMKKSVDVSRQGVQHIGVTTDCNPRCAARSGFSPQDVARLHGAAMIPRVLYTPA